MSLVDRIELHIHYIAMVFPQRNILPAGFSSNFIFILMETETLISARCATLECTFNLRHT